MWPTLSQAYAIEETQKMQRKTKVVRWGVFMDAMVLIRPHRRNESLGQIASDESLTCEPQLAFTSTVNRIQAKTPARLVASRTAGADCGLTLRRQAFPRD
jgi:hypothetical protein